jgi:hypothetical protein
MRLLKFISCLVLLAAAATSRADDARFDLPGPKIDIYVTRGATTLPIAQVPNLLPQDKLQVKADLPATQSNHLLLIVAFLRGTTNEPPDDWFTRIETWKPTPPEGTTIVIPDGAQRVLLFVAPETGGDFNTLRSAVKGNPGLFIRAGMSLDKASLEQQRIERYLAGMQAAQLEDERAIESRSAKLAATLALKPNADCFKQPVDDQVDCLTQTSAPLLLDDGHGQTVTDAISTGASSDLINEAGQADGAVYSAYVGTLVDLVHLATLLHTAQYRYIPAISFPQGPTLNLKLNAPPSFNNPKSVIVISLPAIQPSHPPMLRLANPQQAFCLANPAMTLPLRGAPLVFSTAFAHDLVLDFGPNAAPRIVPLTPDAFDGGLVRNDSSLHRTLQGLADDGAPQTGNGDPTQSSLMVQGTLRGYWGFDTFTGPTLTFQRHQGGNWALSGVDALVAGQNAYATLHGTGTACIHQVMLASDTGARAPVTFSQSASGNDALNLELPLKGQPPGDYSLAVQQFGSISQSRLHLTVYDNTTRVQRALIGPSGLVLVLLGQQLNDVVSARIDQRLFLPLVRAGIQGSLELQTSGAASSANASEAVVKLKDGRSLTVPLSAENPGAMLKLLSFESTLTPRKGETDVVLGSQMDIPLHGTLHFVVQSMGVFPRTQTIEIATADGALHTSLSLNSDDLILQDDHTAVGTLDLDKAFGESAFGELRLRAVPGDGTYGNWITLGKLVRRPHITAVRCTSIDVPACMIEGSDLFLALAFSSKQSFEGATPVPTGFDGPIFSMPMKNSPRSTTLYLKLRDDPEAVATIRIQSRETRP